MPTCSSVWRLAQPQGDVGWLHGLLYHVYQVVVQGVQVRFVAQADGEDFQSLAGVVLAAVEAAVYERLDAVSQGGEQRSYQQRGSDDREGGLVAGEEVQDALQHHDG